MIAEAVKPLYQIEIEDILENLEKPLYRRQIEDILKNDEGKQRFYQFIRNSYPIWRSKESKLGYNIQELTNEGSGVLYQRKHWWNELDFSPKNIYENVKRHPLGTGTALGGLLGAASFGGYTATSIPYALTAGTAFATVGSLALGALVGGLFGLGLAGLLYYGWFKGKRKYSNGQQNPQYKGESRSWLKGAFDWMTEMYTEGNQSAAKAAQAMLRG